MLVVHDSKKKGGVTGIWSILYIQSFPKILLATAVVIYNFVIELGDEVAYFYFRLVTVFSSSTAIENDDNRMPVTDLHQTDLHRRQVRVGDRFASVTGLTFSFLDRLFQDVTLQEAANFLFCC